MKGNKHALGLKHSEESKKKMRENHVDNSGIKHPRWKGRRRISNGYVYIWNPNHPFSIKGGHIKRSRYVMEKYLGRYLKPREVVHHKNEIRDDDRIENLSLFASKARHTSFHHYIKKQGENYDTHASIQKR